MKQFLSIVLRSQFNLFYRFGYTFIPKSELIEFNDIISNETKKYIIKQFSTVTPFEYDEEYLIIHFEKSINSESEFFQFEIQDIVAIYPLSQQAKISIESKIDERIRLENPIFEILLPTIETEIEYIEIKKAISALWEICKIDCPIEKFIDNIGLEQIFSGLEFRKHGTKANKIQDGNYWEYLIAYDYYQYFPEGIIRYFYQLGEIFSYYKGKSDGIEGTKIEENLKKIGSGNFDQILQKFNEKSLPLSFIEAMQEIGKSEFNPIIVSVLFLKWKTDLSIQDIEITKSSIFFKGEIAFMDKFPHEVKLALILLGAFFGFRKFYDNYYELLNLRFYKSYKVQQKVEVIQEEHQEQMSTASKNEVAENFEIDVKIEEENSKDKLEKETNEIKIEEQMPNAFDNDKQEIKADISTQYSIIIEQAFKEQNEIKLTDIVALIKEKTNQDVTDKIIKRVIKQMEGVEIIPKKKPEMARRKETTGKLFI